MRLCQRGFYYGECLTHWIGGMGIIVLAINAILPLLGIGGMPAFCSGGSWTHKWGINFSRIRIQPNDYG